MKILVNGTWVTPVIDNNVNSVVKIFFDGKWQNILTKGDLLNISGPSTSYIDNHLVYVYVGGNWVQIAIEEDIRNYTLTKETLSFRKNDMSNYTSNLAIRPENSYLSAVRIMSSTQNIEINQNTGLTFVANELDATDTDIRLKGFTKRKIDLLFGKQYIEDYSTDTNNVEKYPNHVELMNNMTSVHTIYTKKSRFESFEIHKAQCDFYGSYAELRGVLPKTTLLKFDVNTIHNYTMNYPMMVKTYGVEVTNLQPIWSAHNIKDSVKDTDGVQVISNEVALKPI